MLPARGFFPSPGLSVAAWVTACVFLLARPSVSPTGQSANLQPYFILYHGYNGSHPGD